MRRNQRLPPVWREVGETEREGSSFTKEYRNRHRTLNCIYRTQKSLRNVPDDDKKKKKEEVIFISFVFESQGVSRNISGDPCCTYCEVDSEGGNCNSAAG